MKISILHLTNRKSRKKTENGKEKNYQKKGKHFSELKDKNAQIAKPSSV